MKTTNIYNLPQAFENLANEEYEITPNSYGATTMLKGIREIILTRRYFDNIEQDVSDMVWMILGSAVHKILESHDATGQAETKFMHPLSKSRVTGVIDLYGDGVVEDYKTATVWKVIFGDFEDWRRQGIIYVWLLRKNGVYADKLRFHALLKDWTAREARYKKDYPQHSVWTWRYNVTTDDLIWIEQWLTDKIHRIESMLDMADDDLPQCSVDERWQTPCKYAAMKNGRKSALKVSENKADVEGIGDYVETRNGEARKCMDYCPVRNICKYGRESRAIMPESEI